MNRTVFIGCNSDAKAEGLHVLTVDDVTGKIVRGATVHERDMIFTAVNRARTRLYTPVTDDAFGPRGHNGGLAVFDITGAAPHKLGTLATGETAPCHDALSPDGRTLYFAEYSHGTAGCVRLTPDGSFEAASLRVVRMTDPTGPNKPRQDHTHGHCSLPSPDGRYVYIVDLGTDRIKAYDAAMNALPEKDVVTTPAGAGPRHIVFHPNGRLAFVLFELENYVTSYAYADGKLTPVQQLSLLPDDWGCGATDERDPHFSKAAAVKVSEDGTELYCSNRGHDSLAVFSVDPGTGLLSRRGILPLGGRYPRDFTFLPGGRILLACLKMSGIVRTYRYDRMTCAITPADEISGLYRPLRADCIDLTCGCGR